MTNKKLILSLPISLLIFPTPTHANYLFDPWFYLSHNPDVAQAQIDPLYHFNTYGWRELRNPNPLFSTHFYLSENPDVAAYGMNPLDHYLYFGWREYRDPSEEFSTSSYLFANPDVHAANMNPLFHYLTYGKYENRPITYIHNLAPYISSSRNCDGNPTTPLYQSDPITCLRTDYGSLGFPFWMATTTFLSTINNEFGAITTWSFYPIKPFLDPLIRGTCIPQTELPCGDGGEAYILRNNQILAPYTQDGGRLGIVQEFNPPWILGSKQTIPCYLGWTIYSPRERGCTQWINYPYLGWVHTIITENGDSNAVERILLGYGWGRLNWQAFTNQQAVSDLPERCPDVDNWNTSPSNQQHLRLTDCRLTIKVTYEIPKNLTGNQLWKPK